jgi:biopolymer transport protein TolR
MRKNKRRKPMSEINVVPYIDVTLVLLIIFMITTPMLQTGVDVDLPETPEPKMIEEKQDAGGKPIPPIVVSIKIDDNNHGHYFYYINTDGQSDNEIQPDEINEKVELALAGKKNRLVLINADKNIDYGSVVKVMASLKTAGVHNVGLMTKPSDT